MWRCECQKDRWPQCKGEGGSPQACAAAARPVAWCIAIQGEDLNDNDEGGACRALPACRRRQRSHRSAQRPTSLIQVALLSLQYWLASKH